MLGTGQNLSGQKCRPIREKKHKLRHRIIKVWGLLREHRLYLESKGYIQEQESGIPNDESL